MLYYDEGDLANVAPHIDDLSPYIGEVVQRRAYGIIDQETMGRISRLEKLMDQDTMQSLKYACAHVAVELVRQDAVSQKTEGGAVTYANTDGYMETYASHKDSRSAFRLNIRDLLRQYLGSDPYGLLYRGL